MRENIKSSSIEGGLMSWHEEEEENRKLIRHQPPTGGEVNESASHVVMQGLNNA